jgi:hypothetical protein
MRRSFVSLGFAGKSVEGARNFALAVAGESLLLSPSFARP